MKTMHDVSTPGGSERNVPSERAAMRLAYALHICTMTAALGSHTLVALYAAHLGVGPWVIGTLLSASAMAPIIFGLHAGRAVDRFGVRIPMFVGAFTMSGALAVAAVFPHIATLFFTILVVGAGYLLYMVSQQTLVGDVSTGATRARNFANQTLVYSLGGFLGPLIVGLLIEHRSHAAAFTVLAALPIVACGLLLAGFSGRICRHGRRTTAPSVQSRGQSLLRHQAVLLTAVTAAAVLTCVDLFQFYAPLHGHASGLAPTSVAAVMSAYAAAAIVVRIFMPQLIVLAGSEERLLRANLLVAVVAFVTFPLLDATWGLASLAFLLGLGLGCAQPLSMMMTYNASPAGRAGEGLGLRFMFSNAARLLLPLALAPVSAGLGLIAVFWTKAALLLAGTSLARRLIGGRRTADTEHVAATVGNAPG